MSTLIEITYIDHCDEGCGLGIAEWTCPSCNKLNEDYDDLWFDYENGSSNASELCCEHCEKSTPVQKVSDGMYLNLDEYKKQQEVADAFKKEYRDNHALCPECGHDQHSTTLAGYILNMEDKESYVDKNMTVCTKCDYKCIAHDRVPKKQI